MIIKIINPNTTEEMTAAIGRCAEKYADPGTEIICESAGFGVDSIECFVDEYLAVPAVLKAITEGDKSQNVDAYIIACFDDPGLMAARELTDKPVVGIAEAAITTAKFLAPNFSVVSVLDRSRIMAEELIIRNGAERICRSIRSTGLSVLDFERNPEKGLNALETQAKRAVEEDGAECILLGCAGFVDFAEELRNRLGVPVLDGVMPAVKYAEALVKMGQKTCKKNSFSWPEEKEYTGYEGISIVK